MASPLSDLDELVLKCRDKKAKAYIEESISCYKSGAFRSSIISTWIAVAFDIIDKLKDLELSGDNEAKIHIKVFENAVKNADINASLKFEREILKIAKNKLELISQMEFIDLARLQEDRNRCAHPSLTIDGEIFNPPAELARVHIRTAIESLLQHPPVQGKAALKILNNEVKSKYFPTNLKKAVLIFKNSPLNKARKSLVRNFIVCLLKILLKKTDSNFRARAIYALNAVEKLHKSAYVSTMKETLSNQIKALDDTKLHKTFIIFSNISESWEYLEDDVKIRLENYVENLPTEKFDNLDFLLGYIGLKKVAIKRLDNATESEINKSYFMMKLPIELSDKMIDLYINSSSYVEANNNSRPIIIHNTDFSKKQIKKIFIATRTNYEIKGSHELHNVLKSLRKNDNVTGDDFKRWALDTKTKE